MALLCLLLLVQIVPSADPQALAAAIVDLARVKPEQPLQDGA